MENAKELPRRVSVTKTSQFPPTSIPDLHQQQLCPNTRGRVNLDRRKPVSLHWSNKEPEKVFGDDLQSIISMNAPLEHVRLNSVHPYRATLLAFSGGLHPCTHPNLRGRAPQIHAVAPSRALFPVRTESSWENENPPLANSSLHSPIQI